MRFTSKRVLRRGSQKGVSRRFPDFLYTGLPSNDFRHCFTSLWPYLIRTTSYYQGALSKPNRRNSAIFADLGEKKNNRHKEIRGKPLHLDCDHGCVHLSCGNVPSVPQTFCPIYVELHINRSGRPGCPRIHPQTVPGTLPGHTDHQIPLCGLCLSVFLLPNFF